jgi:uncharacterized protein (TIGR03118 family)
VRIVLTAIAVCGVIAMVPYLLLSQTTIVNPTFTVTLLVSDIPGQGKFTNANLVNPWGMALGVNSGLWVAGNGTGIVQAFDGTGLAIASTVPLSVMVPAPGGGTSSPTGVATSATTGFVISSGAASGPAAELFATEDGTIVGWSSSVDNNRAIIAVDNSASGAVYKGLAIGFTTSGAFLYATNFHAGTIDVFDSKFQPVKKAGMFTDPNLPAGYAPFGIASINARLYVSYAQQDKDKKDDVAGNGHGFIDIFETDGTFVRRFTSQGTLNSPWGMAWAPFEGFGGFNNGLFVGNFGDGLINVFDFDSGDLLGQVSDVHGNPIHIRGLWALQFGLGVANGSSDALFFTAGGESEQHGYFGTLTVNPFSVPKVGMPSMTDVNLTVSTVVSGLDQPTSMVFLGPGDFLVLEKASGKVKHVVNGQVVGTALDLAVNSASERGLLGIALQPDFATSHGVYLYWTQSTTGADSTNLTETPLLGNRVDRFVWDPNLKTLSFDKNLIMLHAFQADSATACCGSSSGQPMRGNHDGGKILFGADGKLYFQIGDNGRRGQLQNLAGGPFGGAQPDDQSGGPAPDDAHLTGAIFRLNPDGTTPSDNPFANVTMDQLSQLETQAGVTLTSAQMTNVLANIRKVYSYGRRNGFGLAVDPITGLLWESENGDDAFDEINQITAGSNGGWIQIMGPSSLLKDFKGIESSFTPMQGNLAVAGNLPFSAIDPATFIPALQQIRWSPTMIADSASDAMSRLFVLPGSKYAEPEFSWRWAVAPAAIGFAGSAMGSHANNLFVGASRTFLAEGYLFEFKFDASRQHFAFTDPALKDGVDNNDYKFDMGESTSLMAGKNFGIVTNIVTGPDGALYVTSLSNGAVYMIR